MNSINASSKYQSFKIGKWRVHPKALTFHGPDGIQKVGPNMMELLLIFVENQGQVLDTETLHRIVWRDVVVSDGTIRKTISNLKNYFTLDGKTALNIQVVRSQGYKLSEDVTISYLPAQTGFLSILSHRFIHYTIALLGLSIIGIFSLTWYQNRLASEVIAINNLGISRSPELADNGRKMVYSGSSDQQSIEDIFLYNFENQETKTLISSPYVEVHPTITNDAKRLAYIASRSNSANAVYELDIESKKEKHLLSIDYSSPLRSLDWSPNGKNLAISFASIDDPIFKIHILDVVNQNVESITHPHPQIFGDINPKYSPYGDSIAFIRTQNKSLYYDFFGGVGDVYVQDLNTQQLQKVTRVNSEITGLDWSEDGKELFYILMNESMNFEIRRVNLANSEEKIIYSSEEVLRNLSIDNKITFERHKITYRFIKTNVTDTASNSFEYINLENGKYWYPTFGNTDDKLAFISTQSGFPELWIKTTGQETRQITEFKGAYLGKPKWSSKDDKIVVPVTRKGNSDIYVYDLAKNELVPLLNSSFNEMAPEWSEDDSSLYFVADYEQKSQIWKIDVRSIELVPALFLDLPCDYFVRKGNEIYYSNVSKPEIRKYNLDNKSDKLVSSALRKKDTRNWDIRGDHIYYIRLNPGYKRVLVKKNLTDGNEITMSGDEAIIGYTLQGISTNQPGITVSNNGKTIIAVTYAGKDPEIMVLNR